MNAICAMASLTLVGASALGQTLEPGLTLRIYEIGRPIDRLYPLGEDQTPNVDGLFHQLDLFSEADFGTRATDHFVVEAFGWLKIDTPGSYVFGLHCDDGARLQINDEEVVVHDGLHAPSTKTGTIDLAAGLHRFHIDMFENAGGAALALYWQPPGANEPVLVPPEAFLTEKGVTRVVSPGLKVLLDGKEHMRPGDGMTLDRVHPGWTVENLRPEGFEPQVGAMKFLPDGRLVLASFQPVNNGIFREAPNGTIWALENVIGTDTSKIRAVKIADGFHDPCGLEVVDGDIYISHRPDITRLRDSDGDGTFETREVFVTPWISDNYHHFSFGLVEHDGWLYGTLSTSIYFNNTIQADGVEGTVVSMNGPNPPNRGTCYRVNLQSRDVEFLAGGFRTPNGIEITPDGDIFVADNQGAWLPASKLVHVKPGRFYGHANGLQRSERYPDGGSPSLHADQPVSPPALWLPQNEICNSPSEPLTITRGEFAGQLLLGELTMGGIRRIFLQEVDGELQGAAFRFTQGLEGGVNRLIEGPDGCLYVGCTGAGGNWSWRGTQFGLQRLRPTGARAFEFHSMTATPDGFDVRFTRPVDTDWLADPANYALAQWRYEPTPQYGGPKHDVEELTVTEAKVGRRGMLVHLVVPGLKEGHVVHLRTAPQSIDGDEMWSTEAWYTLQRIPR